jgi:hypothetical protein
LEYDYQTISLVAEKGYVFPSSIVGSFSNDFFFFSEKRDSDSGVVYRAEIYLRVSYSEADFLNEIERVSKLECYGKKPVLVGDLFSLPCLVASYNLFSYFEYALLDYDKNQIYYVYLYSVGSYSQIVFDSQYSPQKKLFDSSFPSDLATSYGAYSMYWSY